ncbi:nitroreductase family protein [endosymbiont GvMRE of Glomus versiforme]|uniref:nitroreductase family protein n=1 Tax=endosymbiont GvMRE of Glomus versiforme TaxID=2039283 RepID=UPI001C0F37C6|nr:nitroreductase family protein [endosymbiont GvMRE of Glomus versiforme]
MVVEKVIKIVSRCPSSYGLEPWFILVIKESKIRQELYPFINYRSQVLNCSHLFLVLYNQARRIF